MTKKEFLAIRQRLGLTQGELAKRMRCDQPTVSRLESGEHAISPLRASFMRMVELHESVEKKDI